MIKPKYHIFICSSSRINGIQKGYCHSNGAIELVSKFMEEIEDYGLSGEVMVTNTGCLGVCNKGPIVVIYPEGTWYGAVTIEDVEEIMESHIQGGVKVGRLEI